MKTTIFLIMILLSFISMSSTSAAEQMNRSAETQLNDNGIPLAEKLQLSPVTRFTAGPPVSRTFGKQAVTASVAIRQAEHGLPVAFEIFDARAEATADLDGDGYYHRLTITFDADVNSTLETVYAKLYLSYEGGDWQTYATSDLFQIYDDSAEDRYEIITELLEGYQPGYYDVLIELHSLYHTGIVAKRIISTDNDGHVLALEDREHDEYYAEEIFYTGYGSYGATGSFSMVGFFLLGLLVVIKFRGLWKLGVRLIFARKVSHKKALQKLFIKGGKLKSHHRA
jgi:hypothetical protein